RGFVEEGGIQASPDREARRRSVPPDGALRSGHSRPVKARTGMNMPMTEPNAFDGSIRPTKETYDQIQQAYDTLNRALFKGELPNCLITLQRRNRTYGYFSGDRFGRSDGLVTDEIALNPRHFHNPPCTEVSATPPHEMPHLWQYHHGKPARGRYHNREWA